MLVNDRIYGSHKIDEPVLVRLMASDPLLRLTKINQSGASQYLFPWKNVSRFEHSVGVMLILRMYRASLAAQVAGLLHDIPHTAFSHVADFVYDNPRHEYHELFYTKMIQSYPINEILKKHHIGLTIHPEKFGLLEKKIPDLCADRIDYALRDYFSWKGDRERLQAKLSGLIVYQGEFMFDQIYAAETFARDFLEMDREIWANPRETAAYEILAQALRHALDKRILDHTDLFGDDESVFNLLKIKGDAYINKKLEYLTGSFRIEPASATAHHLYLKTKIRYVDPKIRLKDKVERLSRINSKFQQLLQDHIRQGNKGHYVYIFKR